MTVELHLNTNDGNVVATHQGVPLGAPTPLADLPRITADSNPYRYATFELGHKLFRALGGDALTALLDRDPDATLHLVTDDQSAGVPWEYAATPQNEFLVCMFGFLRLLPTARPAPAAKPGPLNFVALAADPLVDESGNPRTGYKLDIETELLAIADRLEKSNVDLTAQRTPPTRAALQRAISRGPAILHLSCHGSVIDTEQGKVAVLQLEDENGKAAPLRSDQLLRLPLPGVLRLAVFSACRSAASAMDANLARTLVLSGIPAAIGMQGDFPDPLSDDLAATLYDFLLQGYGLGEALRQARWAMIQHPYAVGLPVAYIAPGGDQPLPLPAGQPRVAPMTRDRYTNLPLSLHPPQPLLGREADLHALAQMFSQGHKVVTVVGTGGIGKTALSSAFAQRFGWRFPNGVIGVSLADLPTLSPVTFFLELLSRLPGIDVRTWADQPATRLAEELLQRAGQRLLLIDNYESVLDALEGEQTASSTAPPPQLSASPAASTLGDQPATTLHRLLAKLAESGLTLLLTSRRQPAGLAGEVVFPPQSQALAGVQVAAGAKLFIHHSTRLKDQLGNAFVNYLAEERLPPLARQVAAATEGHPLAIALLAGEYDQSRERNDADFLAHWDDELATARRSGQATHQVTFTVAFDRSFHQLNAEQQWRLAALSRFPAPFFAEGAALLWGQALAEQAARPAQISNVHVQLDVYVRRSLLKVDGTFTGGDQPATYRLEPVIARTLARTLTHAEPPTDQAVLDAGYTAYAGWLVQRAYGETGRDVGVARLIQQWLDELIDQVQRQPSHNQARYAWQLGVMLRQFGRTKEALPMLQMAEDVATAQQQQKILARILHAKAELLVILGELDQAVQLWQRCLQLNDQPADEGERGANLHGLAQVFMTRGDLDRALRLYEESLALLDKLGDLKGKAATLSGMANVWMARQNWAQAEQLLLEALSIAQQLPHVEGVAFQSVKLGQIAQARGDVAIARQRYTEGLTIFVRLRMPEANQVSAMLAALDQPAAPQQTLTPAAMLVRLTQAAVAAARGQQAPSEVAAASEQLAAAVDLPAALAAYLTALAAVVRAPQASTLDALHTVTEQVAEQVDDALAADDSLSLRLAIARLFDQHQQPASAAYFQAQAIAALRTAGNSRDAQQTLSVALYNQADYLAQLDRFAEAVTALAEVVAIDQRFGLDDLAADQQALAEMRQRADPTLKRSANRPVGQELLAGEEEEQLAAFQAQLAALAPAEQARLLQAMQAYTAASPDEQQAIQLAQRRQAVLEQVENVVEAALAAVREKRVADFLPRLDAAAESFAEGEPVDSPWHDAARFVTAVAAQLRGAAQPLVLVIYAAQFAAFQRALADAATDAKRD